MVGIVAQSGTQQNTSIYSNVRLYIPAKEGFIPYTDYIGSILEIIEVSTGKRKVIFTSPDCIEAPNWTHDGQHLIVNCKGLLYSINIESGEQKLIDTSFATKNNNDHGISPDGKQLVISHHAQEKPHNVSSTLYVLPIEGGTPLQVTQNSPSYWHGWSPDGQWLYYTANRNNKWNIFKIKVCGGEEIQLTDNEFLNDGSDCSPDGKYIWFNSNRNGIMQIWRMKTDGSEQIQITHDERQNWFAHPSPDNTKIVYLSYPPEVNFWDHPYYKHVYLCLMNIDGQNMQVLAPLYGGQGTINVPSWSPDSRFIAFVSHTDI
jgi:Tol biopolymer transport system component